MYHSEHIACDDEMNNAAQEKRRPKCCLCVNCKCLEGMKDAPFNTRGIDYNYFYHTKKEEVHGAPRRSKAA